MSYMDAIVRANLSVGKIEGSQTIGSFRWMAHFDAVLLDVRMRRRQMQRIVTEARVKDAVVAKVGVCLLQKTQITDQFQRMSSGAFR